MVRRLGVVAVVVAGAVVGLAPAAAAHPADTSPADTPPVSTPPGDTPPAGTPPVQAVQAAGGFVDVTGGVHKPAIDALVERGLFDGTECGEDMFCPGDEMKRWTMAVWLVRVLDEAEPAAATESSFADVDVGNRWLAHIERLADAYPILVRGERVFVAGYTIGVVAADGNTHIVQIIKGRP